MLVLSSAFLLSRERQFGMATIGKKGFWEGDEKFPLTVLVYLKSAAGGFGRNEAKPDIPCYVPERSEARERSDRRVRKPPVNSVVAVVFSYVSWEMFL